MGVSGDHVQRAHEEATRLLREEPLPYNPRMRRFVDERNYAAAMASTEFGYYSYLGALVRAIRPRTVLELGTCEGGSALFMLLSLPEDARLVTVDVQARGGRFLGPCLEDPRLHVLRGSSLDLTTYGGLELGEINLLFVDTLHTYAQASAEWRLYGPMLSEHGVAAFDDIHLNTEMERLWTELPEPKVDTGAVLHHSGFGICGKPTS